MKRIDILCSLGIAASVYLYHLLVSGWDARFEVHPAVVFILVFFCIFGAYRMFFGRGQDR